jgi:hypothetical protein
MKMRICQLVAPIAVKHGLQNNKKLMVSLILQLSDFAACDIINIQFTA